MIIKNISNANVGATINLFISLLGVVQNSKSTINNQQSRVGADNAFRRDDIDRMHDFMQL